MNWLLAAETVHTANQAPAGEVVGIVFGLVGLIIGVPGLVFWLQDRKTS